MIAKREKQFLSADLQIDQKEVCEFVKSIKMP